MRFVSLFVERFGTLENLELDLVGKREVAAPVATTIVKPEEPSRPASRTRARAESSTTAKKASARSKTAKPSSPSLFSEAARAQAPAAEGSGRAGAGSGFTLVHGPNEAGKTTLLRAVRYLLLGDDRTSTGKRSGAAAGEAPSVRALVELGSGSHVQIHRRKAKPSFIGRMLTTGDEAAEDWFMGAIGHPDASLFRNVFAFSLDELAKGASDLEKEKSHLGGLIFGSGLGGMIRPSTLLAELEAAKSKLFIAKGRQQSVPTKHARIEALKAELRDATTAPDVLERLDLAIADKQRAANTVKETLLALRREEDRMHALASAIEPFAEWRAAKNELEALGVAPELPDNARIVLERSRVARAQAEEELERQAAQRPELERELANLTGAVDENLLSVAADIEALDRSLSAVVAAERDLAARGGEREALLRRIERQLAELAPTLGLLRLRDLVVPREVRASIAAAAEDLERLGREARDGAALVKNTTKERAHLVKEQEELAAVGAPLDEAQATALRAWLEEARKQLAAREVLATHEAEVARHRKAAARLFAKLDPAPPGDDPASAPVPRVDEVDEFARYLDEHEENLRGVDRDIAKTDAELTSLHRQIAEIRADGDVPNEGDLARAREKRASGWALVQRALDGHLDVRLELHFDSDESLVAAFENAMNEADDIVDRMRFRADAVQRRAQKEAAIVQIETELERLVEQRNDRLAEQATAHSAWNALWAPTGVRPRMPAVMRAWLADRDLWLSVSEQLADASAAVIEVAGKIGGSIERGRALLHGEDAAPHDALASDLPALVAEAERKLTREVDRSSAIARNRVALARADEAIARAIAQSAEIVEATEWADAAYRGAFASTHLPDVPSPKHAAPLVEELLRLRETWLDAEAADTERGAKLEAQVEAFAERLAGVLERLGRKRAPGSIEGEVERLREAVAAATLAQRRAAVVRERLELLGDEEARQRGALARAQEALADLRDKAHAAAPNATVTSDEELARAIERSKLASDLRHAVSEAERAIARVRGPWEATALLTAAEGASREALAAELRSIEARRTEASELHDRLLEELATAKSDRARLDGSARAAERLEDVASERAALRADVEQYAVLALAKAVLERSIEDFERTHQPALVDEASRLFALMTNGRYPRVRATAKRELFVERENGERRSPEELSTGTNEQLFFALRLAYVSLYGKSAEPLPVVLDDVLVNFDRGRTAATLAALGSFAERTQVLFFTCHSHLVDLTREVLPGAHVLALR